MTLNATAHDLPTAEVLVPGHSATNAYNAVHNPARTSELVGRVAAGTGRDVDRAVEVARAALPVWAGLSVQERADLLLEAAVRLRVGDQHSRVELLTREHGKVLWEASLDVQGAAAILDYYAGLADQYAEEVHLSTAAGAALVTRRPIGVTAVIVPWNYPVYLAFLMLVPALLAGNPVVIKPSQLVPLALSDVLKTLMATLPPGVVTVVPGTGREVGVALAEHRGVRALFFTGSTETGRSVVRNSAGNLKRLGLELGGNDPAIVLDTARMDDEMIREMVRGVYTSSGQVCYAVKRIYVHRQQHDEFVARFTDAVGSLVVGDGLDPNTDMGPLNNRQQLDKVQDLVRNAEASGARVTPMGKKADAQGWNEGHFMLPTIVTGIAPEAPLVVEEQFGPAVPILPYDDEVHALEMANATEHGLAASVWSADHEHAMSVARGIDAGSVFINAHRIGASALSLPFGGMKESGLGRRHGFWALEESSEIQVIADITGPSRLPGPVRP